MTERSTAIVLFTDLVGSTELRSRLGEDAADALRKQHDVLVAGAIETNRGAVVKNLGDGIMATFIGASDAVSAAVATQQGIDRHNRSSPTALEVRIGISAGDVVFEKDDCFGTPVIEAARLCAAARGGQILASEIVRWMARSGEATFTPVGNLELKGLPEAVPAVEVGWEPLAQSSVPLPTFLTDIGRIFVGRDGELDRLGQLWKEAAAGQLPDGTPGRRARCRQDQARRRAGQCCPRRRRNGARRPLRRGPRRAVPAVRRVAAPLRGSCFGALGAAGPVRRGVGPARARAQPAGARPTRTSPVGPRDGALPALRRSRHLACRHLGRRAGIARARRSPVGGEADAPAPAAHRPGRPRTGPPSGHVPGHRTDPRPPAGRTRRRPPPPRRCGTAVAQRARRRRRRGHRRAGVGPPARRNEPGPGPSGLPGDRREPVLRPGGASPSGRDGRRRTARGRLDDPAFGRPARHPRRGPGCGGSPPRAPV